jgi:hypothetical protein
VPINKWANMCQSTKGQTCANQQMGKHVPINKWVSMCHSTDLKTRAINRWAKSYILHADQQMVQDVPINRRAEKIQVNRRAKL